MASSAACHRPQLPDFILTDKLGSGTYATVYKAYRKASWCHLINTVATVPSRRYCSRRAYGTVKNLMYLSMVICLSVLLKGRAILW